MSRLAFGPTREAKSKEIQQGAEKKYISISTAPDAASYLTVLKPDHIVSPIPTLIRITAGATAGASTTTTLASMLSLLMMLLMSM